MGWLLWLLGWLLLAKAAWVVVQGQVWYSWFCQRPAWLARLHMVQAQVQCSWFCQKAVCLARLRLLLCMMELW